MELVQNCLDNPLKIEWGAREYRSGEMFEEWTWPPVLSGWEPSVDLQTAINNASAGDVLVLANGTYLNNTLSISKSNITVKAATLGGVFLNGSNAITISGSYVTFSGFQFTSGDIGIDTVIFCLIVLIVSSKNIYWFLI